MDLQNGAVRTGPAHRVRRLSRDAVRYALAGAAVALSYIGLTLLLSGPGALPIQLAIAVAYLLAVALHFTLQRAFVFRDRQAFALSGREQAGRYVAIGVAQYSATAAATAVLPAALGASEEVVYVGTVVVISAATFLVLRTRVFH
jgi:putative flippase GtrA